MTTLASAALRLARAYCAHQDAVRASDWTERDEYKEQVEWQKVLAAEAAFREAEKLAKEVPEKQAWFEAEMSRLIRAQEFQEASELRDKYPENYAVMYPNSPTARALATKPEAAL